MEQSNQSKKVLLSVIGIAILVVAVVGVSFAFFSYTSTSGSNSVTTGTIIFTASTTELSVTNAFPVSSSTAASQATSGNGVAVGTVAISGNTNYASGIDYQVKVGTITPNTGAGATIVPKITVQGPATAPTGVTQTLDHSGTGLTAGEVLAHGTIAANQTVTSATILTIKMYYDIADYHISDNTKTELVNAGLLDNSYAGTIVAPATWNALSGYSFTIIVNAVEGGSTFTARNAVS